MEIKPVFSEFKSMAGQGNLIPVYREFLGDMETPVSTYLKIRDKSFSYLLESAESGTRWGRYSFIGYKPYLMALSRDRGIEIQEGGRKETLKDVANPFNALRDLCRKFQLVKTKDAAPFQGGLVGYANYDLVRKWERIPGLSPEDDNSPECLFIAPKRLIIYDHLTHRITVVAFAHLTGKENLANPFEATRYHSLIVERRSLPECLELSSWTAEGEIMGLRHREYDVEGVQFHIESILTKEGPRILQNFLRQGGCYHD